MIEDLLFEEEKDIVKLKNEDNDENYFAFFPRKLALMT